MKKEYQAISSKKSNIFFCWIGSLLGQRLGDLVVERVQAKGDADPLAVRPVNADAGGDHVAGADEGAAAPEDEKYDNWSFESKIGQ